MGYQSAYCGGVTPDGKSCALRFEHDGEHSSVATYAAPEPVTVTGHGVWYIDRKGELGYRLSESGQAPRMTRPERDVAIALLRWSLERLEAQE